MEEGGNTWEIFFLCTKIKIIKTWNFFRLCVKSSSQLRHLYFSFVVFNSYLYWRLYYCESFMKIPNQTFFLVRCFLFSHVFVHPYLSSQHYVSMLSYVWLLSLYFARNVKIQSFIINDTRHFCFVRSVIIYWNRFLFLLVILTLFLFRFRSSLSFINPLSHGCYEFTK